LIYIKAEFPGKLPWMPAWHGQVRSDNLIPSVLTVDFEPCSTLHHAASRKLYPQLARNYSFKLIISPLSQIF
jgi:hypothetical protein